MAVNKKNSKKISNNDKRKRKLTPKTKEESEITSDESSIEEREILPKKSRVENTKEYINKLKQKLATDENDQTNSIATILEKELEEKSVTHQKKLADSISKQINNCIPLKIKTKAVVSALALGKDHVFIGCKNCHIYKYSRKTGELLAIVYGNKKSLPHKKASSSGHVLSLSISDDEKFLVSTSHDKLIHIWDPQNLTLIRQLVSGHKGYITDTAFRKDSYDLYTCSVDKTLKIWNLENMTYLDTMFGHESEILNVDCLHTSNVLTSGGFDYTLRLFKIATDTQMVYKGDKGQVQEYCLLLNEKEFVSVSDQGSLLFWKINKGKPVLSLHNVHNGSNYEFSINTSINEHKVTGGPSKIITSLCVIPYSDFIITGSYDSQIHIWKYSLDETYNITKLSSIEMQGIVSNIKVSNNGKYITITSCKEPRNNRLITEKTQNTLYIYNLDK